MIPLSTRIFRKRKPYKRRYVGTTYFAAFSGSEKSRVRTEPGRGKGLNPQEGRSKGRRRQFAKVELKS